MICLIPKYQQRSDLSPYRSYALAQVKAQGTKHNSQYGFWASFRHPHLQKSPFRTHIFCDEFFKNVNFKHTIDFFHLNIMFNTLLMDIMPYFIKWIMLNGCYCSEVSAIVLDYVLCLYRANTLGIWYCFLHAPRILFDPEETCLPFCTKRRYTDIDHHPAGKRHGTIDPPTPGDVTTTP